MLEKNSPIPLYTQLIDKLINEIEKNYNINEKIISEREICQQYNVSRTTVRKALRELEDMGYIYKKYGKGTFVAERHKEKNNLLEIYSFTENMKAQNRIPKTIIISFEEIPLNQHVASKMNLTEKESVLKLERIRLADEKPMMYEISYLPIDIFTDLTLNKLKEKPLYNVFREDYNQTIAYADEEFSAGTVRQKEARILEEEEDSACLRIQRLSRNSEDKIIEYTLSAARSDQFVYKMRHV